MKEVVATAGAGAYTVYRSQGPVLIKGANLGIDIKYGSLIVTANGEVIYVFGPNQWINVNYDPAQ
ncbi:hypothetical protein [Bradyrhizobium mercantei]|uniref:hypothetical protein n=1 Tax=Bradyrhizobium mercantei TaxID=1904807 RepID=UPI000978AFEF|nr:hypothetical protein [Bradyrhizobium mercantei]